MLQTIRWTALASWPLVLRSPVPLLKGMFLSALGVEINPTACLPGQTFTSSYGALGLGGSSTSLLPISPTTGWYFAAENALPTLGGMYLLPNGTVSASGSSAALGVEYLLEQSQSVSVTISTAAATAVFCLIVAPRRPAWLPYLVGAVLFTGTIVLHKTLSRTWLIQAATPWSETDPVRPTSCIAMPALALAQ